MYAVIDQTPLFEPSVAVPDTTYSPVLTPVEVSKPLVETERPSTNAVVVKRTAFPFEPLVNS